MEFSRQEYWSGWESSQPGSSALQADLYHLRCQGGPPLSASLSVGFSIIFILLLKKVCAYCGCCRGRLFCISTWCKSRPRKLCNVLRLFQLYISTFFIFRENSTIVFIVPIFAWNVPLVSLTFLKRSLLLFCILGYWYHLFKFHIYALVYCIGLYLSGLLHSV